MSLAAETVGTVRAAFDRLNGSEVGGVFVVVGEGSVRVGWCGTVLHAYQGVFAIVNGVCESLSWDDRQEFLGLVAKMCQVMAEHGPVATKRESGL